MYGYNEFSTTFRFLILEEQLLKLNNTNRKIIAI